MSNSQHYSNLRDGIIWYRSDDEAIPDAWVELHLPDIKPTVRRNVFTRLTLLRNELNEKGWVTLAAMPQIRQALDQNSRVIPDLYQTVVRDGSNYHPVCIAYDAGNDRLVVLGISLYRQGGNRAFRPLTVAAERLFKYNANQRADVTAELASSRKRPAFLTQKKKAAQREPDPVGEPLPPTTPDPTPTPTPTSASAPTELAVSRAAPPLAAPPDRPRRGRASWYAEVAPADPAPAPAEVVVEQPPPVEETPKQFDPRTLNLNALRHEVAFRQRVRSRLDELASARRETLAQRRQALNAELQLASVLSVQPDEDAANNPFAARRHQTTQQYMGELRQELVTIDEIELGTLHASLLFDDGAELQALPRLRCMLDDHARKIGHAVLSSDAPPEAFIQAFGRQLPGHDGRPSTWGPPDISIELKLEAARLAGEVLLYGLEYDLDVDAFVLGPADKVPDSADERYLRLVQEVLELQAQLIQIEDIGGGLDLRSTAVQTTRDAVYSTYLEMT